MFERFFFFGRGIVAVLESELLICYVNPWEHFKHFICLFKCLLHTETHLGPDGTNLNKMLKSGINKPI